MPLSESSSDVWNGDPHSLSIPSSFNPTLFFTIAITTRGILRFSCMSIFYLPTLELLDLANKNTGRPVFEFHTNNKTLSSMTVLNITSDILYYSYLSLSILKTYSLYKYSKHSKYCVNHIKMHLLFSPVIQM